MQAFCCCTSKLQREADEIVVTESDQIVESPKGDGSVSLVRTTTGRIIGEFPHAELSEESTEDAEETPSDDSGLMRRRSLSAEDDDEAFQANLATLVKTKMLAMRWKERTMAKLRPAMLRASPSMILESKELPLTAEGRADAPLFEEILEGATIPEIRKLLLMDSDDSPLRLFLREVMHCTDLKVSPWMLCNVGGGADVQRTWYRLPVKTDVPTAVTAVLGIPKFVTGCSLNCVLSTQGDLMLLQRSKVQGVKYSERFRVQNLHMFSPDGCGNIRWRMWVEVECIKALPWTHSFLQHHITESTRHEAETTGPQFAVLLRRALAERSETVVRAVQTSPP